MLTARQRQAALQSAVHLDILGHIPAVLIFLYLFLSYHLNPATGSAAAQFHRIFSIASLQIITTGVLARFFTAIDGDNNSDFVRLVPKRLQTSNIFILLTANFIFFFIFLRVNHERVTIKLFVLLLTIFEIVGFVNGLEHAIKHQYCYIENLADFQYRQFIPRRILALLKTALEFQASTIFIDITSIFSPSMIHFPLMAHLYVGKEKYDYQSVEHYLVASYIGVFISSCILYFYAKTMVKNRLPFRQ